MRYIPLILLFIGCQVVAMEEPEKVYRPLSPDAVEKVSDQCKEMRYYNIVQRRSLPSFLQDVEGPLPFHCTGARILGPLLTQYRASLQFDRLEVREETERMREEAKRMESRDPEGSLRTLYRAGWQMGDPLAIQEFIRVLRAYDKKRPGIISDDSNLIGVLMGSIDTVEGVIKSIRMARAAIDYADSLKSRSTSDATATTDDSFELTIKDDTEEEMPLLSNSEGIRRRHVAKP